MSSSNLQQRSQGKQKAIDDPLAKLDEDGTAEPLDEQEQEQVIQSIRESNEKSNYIFRALMLIMMGLVGILYLTPIPDYITGDHPESHLTMLFHPSHIHEASHDDLIRLPAFPIYLALLFLQGGLLFGAAYETMDRMGMIRSKGLAFPLQPHQFGTAPSILAPVLADIRWHPTHAGIRADKDDKPPPVWTTISPRLLYLCLLTLASTPLPLMTFGAGNFINAGWWLITTIALTVLCICEGLIDKFEREAIGLNGMKYAYKGA